RHTLASLSSRPEDERANAIAGEACVRVTAHEPGDRAQPTPVELLDVTVDRGQVAHAPDGLDRVAVAEDVCVLEHLDLTERLAPQRSVTAARRRELCEIADEQAARAARKAHPCSGGGIGPSSPCASAAARASG